MLDEVFFFINFSTVSRYGFSGTSLRDPDQIGDQSRNFQRWRKTAESGPIASSPFRQYRSRWWQSCRCSLPCRSSTTTLIPSIWEFSLRWSSARFVVIPLKWIILCLNILTKRILRQTLCSESLNLVYFPDFYLPILKLFYPRMSIAKLCPKCIIFGKKS